METPKPSSFAVPTDHTIVAASGTKLDPAKANPAIVKKMAPKPTARPRAERSTPVRNPAFREHEGLKALQKQLNSRPAPRKNK